MDYAQVLGIVGASILVLGAAYPERKVAHPALFIKNWLFVIGGLCMFSYALINYNNGGSIFFVILQIFINATSVLMMVNAPDKYDVPFVLIIGSVMILWSFQLFEGYQTALFIAGLSIIGMGYALDTGSVRRNIALAIGSIFVAIFSYIEHDIIFLWLNTFFAAFSLWNAWRMKKERN